jgi:hypothetical protein
VEIRARDSASSAEARVDQRVQVVEGGRATLYTGDSRPVRERRYIQTPGGVVSQEVTVVQDSRMGFDVVPRLAGSRVELEIATANGFTTAAGPIGEWFELGAVAQSRERDDRGIASSSSRSAGETRRVWVRVDRLP